VSRLPVEQLPARLDAINLAGTEVHHLPDWKGYDDPKRLEIIRHIAMMRGRDPRIASLAVDIIKKAGAKPREYKKQAAALLKWVQNPKNVYYVNEPGERLQDPIFTIKQGWGDCFPVGTLVLRSDGKLVPIEQVEEGDYIWGNDKWSLVQAHWFTGEKQLTRIHLNNGSAVTLTDDHKVWVWSCEAHGPKCDSFNCSSGANKDIFYGKGRGPSRGDEGVPRWSLIRLRVGDLEPRMKLAQPDELPCADRESSSQDEAEAWLQGLYTADGWKQKNQIRIAGRDGKPKEQQKKDVEEVCARLGIETLWHERYITVKSKELAERFAESGQHHLVKRIPSFDLTRGEAERLFQGLLADASKNSRGEGWTFNTTSPALATDFRVLSRMLGYSTSYRCVVDHGGLGENPIYRIGVRVPGPMADKKLRVKSIERTAETAPCYDITTDDHFVYLPEHDVSVSQCDDQVIVLTSLFESIRLPWRLVIAGTCGEKKTRHIEGGKYPQGCKWSHIYCMVGVPPFQPVQWYFCETTIDGVPLGWDVVAGDKRYLPELERSPGGRPRVMPSPRRSAWSKRARLPTEDKMSPAYHVAYGDFQPSDYGQMSALGPMVGAAIGASMAQESSDEAGTGKTEDEEGIKGILLSLHPKKLLPGVIAGISIAVGTGLLMRWLEPKLGLKEK